MFPGTMVSAPSPLKPLIGFLRVSTYLIGHLFDFDKIKTSDGRVFEKGRWRASKYLLAFLIYLCAIWTFPIFVEIDKVS